MADDVFETQDRPLDIDVGKLRQKYRQERDKRLRADANDQYVEVNGAFAQYLDDPYVAPGFTRDARRDTVEVLVVGGGFQGQLFGARLRAAGIDDFLMLEKGGDFGGAWYWNRYPGAACDTESYIYLPLLEETGYVPTRKYARAPEILEHARRIGRHFGLYERTLFQTIVTETRWLEDEARWRVTTDRGDEFKARFLILAGGPLHLPKLPGIKGIDTFRGHSFHTSRWDYAYTGGSSAGDLDKLKDKRVGVIGTGATAVQAVPHLGKGVKELYVFQRTPSPIEPRGDRLTDPEWMAGLDSGWQRARMDNFTAVISGGDFDVDLVNDGWTELIGGILLAARRQTGALSTPWEAPAALMERADIEKMERIRARVDSQVADPATAEALKPWYDAFCKRLCFHDDYLQTFNRPNVRLIDTQGWGVDRVGEKGVVVDGKEYELDCLIYATGFEVGTDFNRRIGFDIYGRGGQVLADKWVDGALTLHGFFSHGFPNCFMVAGVQSGQSANFHHMMDERSKHFVYVIERLRELGVRTAEPSVAAEQDWVAKVVKAAAGRQRYLQECTPGYYNLEGAAPSERTGRNGPYWRGPIDFIDALERWREDGSMPGLELTY